jgi:hypothetical protein
VSPEKPVAGVIKTDYKSVTLFGNDDPHHDIGQYTCTGENRGESKNQSDKCRIEIKIGPQASAYTCQHLIGV